MFKSRALAIAARVAVKKLLFLREIWYLTVVPTDDKERSATVVIQDDRRATVVLMTWSPPHTRLRRRRAVHPR